MDLMLLFLGWLSVTHDTVEGKADLLSLGCIKALTLEQSKLSLAEGTSYSDASARAKLKLGLFSYPVLQAADVLVHRYASSP